MPDADISPWQVSGYLLCLVTCLSMLAFLVFVVSPDCARVEVTSGGTASCGMGSGSYLFGAAFAAIAVYAGVRLCRLLFPAWSGY